MRQLALAGGTPDNAFIRLSTELKTMNPHPTDALLIASLLQAEPERPVGEVVQWAALQGDWLVAVAAADRARLVLLPGGGSLWGDIPVGQKRYVTLAEQAWFFVAAEDEVLGAYQVCQLAEAADGVDSLAVARAVCLDALSLLGLVAVPAKAASADEAPQPVSRRGFLRALTGRR